MIVIAIIGILVSVGLANFTSTQKKARDARRKNDFKNIASALDLYYNDNGKYPAPDTGTGIGKIKACGTVDVATACECGEPMQNDKALYMTLLPCDPAASRGYAYNYDDDGSGTGALYKLYAFLENEYDSDIGSYLGMDCGNNEQCNYRILSTNTTQ